MIDLAVTFFVEAFACCFQYTALQANSSLAFSMLTHFLLMILAWYIFWAYFVFYVLDRFFLYIAVFVVFQICLFLPAMTQVGDQPLKISDVIIA
jgi:hypothetical protein